MNLELRILNGLHRGASLPLEPGMSLVLGSAQEADVVLADSGMPAYALRLTAHDDGWAWQRMPAHGAADDAVPPERGLPLGIALDLHGVRICVAPASQAWSFDLAEALPMDGDAPPAPDDDAAPDDGLGPPIDDVDGPGADVIGTAPDETAPPREPARRSEAPRRAAGPVLVAVAIVLGMVTFQAASTVGPVSGWLGGAGADRVDTAKMPARPQAAIGGEPGAHAAPRRPALTREQLGELLVARLKAAELMGAMEVDLGPAKWSIRGDLSADEDRRLERLLAAFFAEHPAPVPFEATIVPAEDLLPFRIGQISSGRLANVVTTDGQRLFVGDSRGGYTLAKVEANRVLFTGKRRIEVNW